MKNTFFVLLLVLALASVSSAQMFIGSKSTGMGGTGVTTAFDSAAAYYNPACMMKSGSAGFQGSFATATEGMDKLMTAIGSAADPAKFVNDNFSNNVNVNGSMWGLIGANFNKVGVTVLPAVNLNLNKPANSLTANGTASGMYSGVVTLGHTFSLPALPALHVGTNLKYLGGMYGMINANALTGGAQQYGDVSGFGLDVGALMSFDIPMVTSINVGIVARDLAESLTTSGKQKTLTVSPLGNTYTEGPEVNLGSQTRTVDSTMALGVSGTIPVVGILLAADIESGKNISNTHFGIEYPVMAGLLALRAGIASGNNMSMTTFGAKIGIPVFPINMALMLDSKNTKNNSIMIDFGAAL